MIDPHLVALLGLTKMGPRRVGHLLAAFGEPAAAWHAVAAGRVDPDALAMGQPARDTTLPMWRSEAQLVAVDDVLARHRRAGIEIIGPAHPDWPPALVDDPEPPCLLFCRGDRSLLARVAVAVVGTRRCTALGRSVARDLGGGLATAGVSVVSGLALGIDGEAHRGALASGGPAVGVVATGLDVVYPSRHRRLWDDVGHAGLLVSEAPAGRTAERWRFPARNRIMAGLAAAVVVVESPASGGSMRTVESALERDTTVLAVPGPVRSRASEGTNQLLFEGSGVARDAADVLAALGAAAPPPPGALFRADAHARGADVDGASHPADDPVLDAIAWPAIGVEQLLAVTGLSFAEVTRRLTELELAGLVERTAAGYQRSVG